jgi:hypothetical protein
MSIVAHFLSYKQRPSCAREGYSSKRNRLGAPSCLTTALRTELGTTLVIGVVKHITAYTAYFRCMVLDQRMQESLRRAKFLSALPRPPLVRHKREFVSYAFLINKLGKLRGKTLGHYFFKMFMYRGCCQVMIAYASTATVPSKRRRWSGQFPAPFGVSPSNFLPVRRRVRSGSGRSWHHDHRARGRKSSPVPIFALTRLAIGSKHIGLHSRRSFFVLFLDAKRRPQAAPAYLVVSIRTSGGRRTALRFRRSFQDLRTGH